MRKEMVVFEETIEHKFIASAAGGLCWRVILHHCMALKQNI
jgi:hypothetical protein